MLQNYEYYPVLWFQLSNYSSTFEKTFVSGKILESRSKYIMFVGTFNFECLQRAVQHWQNNQNTNTESTFPATHEEVNVLKLNGSF